MQISVEHHYARALKKVYAAFCDPEFYVSKFEAIGNRNVKVIDSRLEDEEFFLTVRREARLDVPRMLRSALPEWNTLTQTEHWSPSGKGYVNDVVVKSDLAPISIKGSMELTGTTKKTTNVVTMDIRSSIPLLGRKLEKLGADETAASLEDEYDFVVKHLS